MMLLALLLSSAPPSPSLAPPFEAEIAAAVADVVDVWPVPPALVRAVIQTESAFNARAVSRVGAKGLMQLMPATAKQVGVEEKDLFTPQKNILAGVRLLATLLKHYAGDVVSALVAYNSGPRSSGHVPSNGETPAYVLRIIKLWHEYDPSLPQPSPKPKKPARAHK